VRVATIAGITVWAKRTTAGVAKPSRWLPRRERRYLIAAGHVYINVQFQPFRGLYPMSLVSVRDGLLHEVSAYPSLWSKAMKRISMGDDDGKPMPPLSSESVVFKKFPRLREFLSHTAYEDGSLRQPGRMWLDSDSIAFVCTLFEPTAMVRVRLRAATLDDVLTLAEHHLGSENPAWEIDQWARDKAVPKKKK